MIQLFQRANLNAPANKTVKNNPGIPGKSTTSIINVDNNFNGEIKLSLVIYRLNIKYFYKLFPKMRND